MTKLIRDNQIIDSSQFESLYPNTSFAQPIDYSSFGWSVVFPTPVPDFNPVIQTVTELPPALTELGHYEQRWAVIELDAHTVVENVEKAGLELQAEVVSQMQARLDKFANERNYDTILSACTYASSAIEKFKAEGQRCVDMRDLSWSSLYTYLAEVNQGTKPVPSSAAEVLAEIPLPTWE